MSGLIPRIDGLAGARHGMTAAEQDLVSGALGATEEAATRTR